MAHVVDLFPSSATETRQAPGAVHHLLAAIADLKRLGLDHLELATTEAQRASRALVAIVCAAVVVSVLAFTAWTALVAAGVLFAIERGVDWPLALLGAALVHLVAAAGIVVWMKGRLPEVIFSATVRQLRASAGDPS